MDLISLILVLAIAWIAIMGFVSIFMPEKIIKFRNSISGTKTEITNTSILFTRLGGFAVLIVLLLLFLYLRRG